MRVLLTEDELSAMAELPLLSRCVYVFGIRPYMDYATGTVGERRGVSWQSLAESCFVEHHQGRQDSGTPHRSKIRRAVAVLENEGLVTVQSEGRRLIFRCPLAATDQSAQGKPDRRPTDVRHTKPDTEPDTSKGASLLDFTGKPDTENGKRPTYQEEQKADKPPESGKPVKTTPPVSPPRGERFEEFWAVYPRRENKKKAREKWNAKRLDEMADQIIADVQERLRKHRPWREGVIMHPTTYLNGERWEDEMDTVPPRQVAGNEVGHHRRGGFSEIDHRAEAKQMGFATEESVPWRK